MMSQAKVIQDMRRLTTALMGSNVVVPNSMTDRVVQAIYSGEQNFPMMGGDWLFSLEALARVGKAMFGNDWNRDEFSVLHWQQAPVEQHKRELAQQRRDVEVRQYVHLPSSLASSDYTRRETKAEFEVRKEADLQRLTKSELEISPLVSVQQQQWQDNEAALNRLTKAAKWLGDKCRSADIKTGYGAVANLPLISGQSYSWHCTSDIHHWVNDGSLEIFMASTGKMHRCKAYVSRSDLEREIKTLAHSASIVLETDLGRLPPYLKFAVDMALAQNWLIDGTQDSGLVREAEIAAKWPDAFPNIELSKVTKEAIAKVLGIPDAKAINRSVKASAKAEKK